MTDDFRIEVPFETKPPRLKDLINNHVMGDVWVRDTPFGPVTDSLRIAEKFEMEHKHVLRSIKKCLAELSTQPKFGPRKNLIENRYLPGVWPGPLAALYQHPEGPINFRRNPLPLLYSQNLFV